MKLLNCLLLFTASVIVLSCGNSSTKKEDVKLVEMNLSQYRFPVCIDVPEGSKVNEAMGAQLFEGFSLVSYEVKNDNFVLNVSMIDQDTEQSIDDIVKNRKISAENEDDFVEFIEEDPNGFIYKQKNEDGENFNFYYVIIKDKRAVEFSNGFRIANVTLNEAKAQFASAKSAR